VKKQYRIVIAEDHTILRDGLRDQLSLDPHIEFVGGEEDGRDATCHEPIMTIKNVSEGKRYLSPGI